MYNSKFLFAVALLSVVCALGYVNAQSSTPQTGNSTINLTSQSGTILQGGKVSIGINVSLHSGQAGGSTFQVNNKSVLISNNIGVVYSPVNGYGNPPYTGTIYFIANANATPGTYLVTISVIGADPTIKNVGYYLTIATPTTTTATTSYPITIPNTSASTVPTTTQKTNATGQSSPQSSGNGSLAAIAGFIVVIIIVIGALYFWMQMNKKKAQKKA